VRGKERGAAKVSDYCCKINPKDMKILFIFNELNGL
jgi:hypothetical protein